METYTIRIYPHEYMDRAKQDHFAAFNIADKISNEENLKSFKNMNLFVSLNLLLKQTIMLFIFS